MALFIYLAMAFAPPLFLLAVLPERDQRRTVLTALSLFFSVITWLILAASQTSTERWAFNAATTFGLLCVIVQIALVAWVLISPPRPGPLLPDEDDVAATTSNSRPVIVLVHGTNDGSETSKGDKWWQSEGELVRQLRIVLPNIETVAFRWTGHNLESARRDAGGKFRIFLEDRLRRQPVFIVAHSHGGNVVRRAIDGWSGPSGLLKNIRKIVTVGTPFFVYSAALRIRRLMPVAIVGLLLLVPGLFLLSGFIKAAGAVRVLTVTAFALGIVGFCILTISVSLIAYVYVEWVGTNSGKRISAQAMSNKWVNFCGRNDEVFLLLNFVSGAISFVPRSTTRGPIRGAIYGSISAGIAISVVAAASPALATVLVGFLSMQQQAFALLTLGGLAAIVIWYPISNVVGRASDAIRELGVSWVERVASEQIRRSAFGDDGSYGISGISELPWPRVGEYVEFDEYFDEELELKASAAAGITAKRIREELAKAEGPMAPRRWDQLMGILTWEELVHTLYLRSTKVCAMITVTAMRDLSEGKSETPD